MALHVAGLTPGCHAAAALGLEDCGVLEVGRRAEFAVWDFDDPAALAYGLSGKKPVLVCLPRVQAAGQEAG